MNKAGRKKKDPLMTDAEKLGVATHRVRLKLLNLLKGNDNYATKLTTILDAERKTISLHLKTLENAGLVEGKRQFKGAIGINNYNLTTQGKQVLDYINSFKLM